MARMAAGVRKRNDGTLEKRFTLNGKRYSVYGKTSKEIQAKEQEIRKNAEIGLCIEKGRITLDKYFSEWLVEKRKSTKGNSLKTYTSYYTKHISGEIGNKRVQKIEKRDIVALQNILASKLSVTTTNHVIKVLGIIMNDAVKDDIIMKNPVSSVKALTNSVKPATETYHRALTEEEQKMFMNAMEDNYYYEMAAFLLSTGARFGEAAALTWADVDYGMNVIHINKTATFKEDNTYTTGSTKTTAGKRDIPITGNVVRILKRQRAKMGNVIPMQNWLVFPAVRGDMVKNGVLNRAIVETLKTLEKNGQHIDHFTVHAFRDTFATRYIEQGGTPQTLKTILGHSSLSMTMDLYAHVLPNTKQKEMESISISI